MRPGSNVLNAEVKKIGLLIRSAPGSGNAARDQLDIALAAAGLGIELELFFTAEGIEQLLPDRGGHKAWKALPELSATRAWASADTLDTAHKLCQQMSLQVNAAPASEMATYLAACECSMVI